MPARPEPARAKARAPSVPPFQITKVIQEQIKKQGESVFSIFVERRLHHQYRVRVESPGDRVFSLYERQERIEERLDRKIKRLSRCLDTIEERGRD
jgi:hypothetical protein